MAKVDTKRTMAESLAGTAASGNTTEFRMTAHQGLTITVETVGSGTPTINLEATNSSGGTPKFVIVATGTVANNKVKVVHPPDEKYLRYRVAWTGGHIDDTLNFFFFRWQT